MSHVDRSDETSSRARIPRGVRSLSGRLVLLLLVPLVAAQVLTFNTLSDRRREAQGARDLAAEIDLVAVVGSMYAPVALETAASVGMAWLDEHGVPRDIVTQVTGVDYDAYLASARSLVDDALDHLADDHAGVVLDDGTTVGTETAAVRAALTAMRSDLDRREASIEEVQHAMGLLEYLLEGIVDYADAVHQATSVQPVLGALGDHISHLLTTVQAVAYETEVTAFLLGASDGSKTTADLMLAAGAAEYEVSEYASELQGEAAARWAGVALVMSEYRALRPTLIPIADLRSQPRDATDSDIMVTNPEIVDEMADILIAAFERLSALGDYAQIELAEAMTISDSVASDADDQVRLWIAIITAITMASIGFLVLIVVGTARPLSRLTARALRLSEGVIDTRPLALSGPSDVRAVTATFNTVAQVLGSFDAQVRRLSAGGDLGEIDADVVPGMLGQSLRAQVAHLSDMTVRLRESEALSRAIIETAADAIWTVDARGRILTANEMAERLLGVDERHQVGKSLLRTFGLHGSFGDVRELELVRPDGVRIDVLISHSEVPTEPEPIRAVFARDISDRKRFEEQLAHQARHDGLTGLPNRLAALEHLERVVRRVRRDATTVAVLFVDLDGFKSVNDTRGHASGDRLLHEVGRRLMRCVRSSEFVARLGGDEFLVVCESMDVDAARSLGERMIREVAQPYASGDDLFTISASVGIASATGDEPIDALELVRESDVAVYHAKERGRSRVVVFDESLQEAVEATAEIELALRQAIADDELVLHYQPVLDLTTDRPWGAEALVRWNRPGHGLLAPDRFVPVAERSSLVIELGRWVLRSACHTLAAWQAHPQRRHLHIAVNVSGRHLVDGSLVRDLDEVLAETGADPHGLEVELTETHLLADFERANEVLTELRARGISVAVDDFGTGYSSMGYLRQLEIDTLKIDRMFIARANSGGYDRTLVEVLVQLGLTLGLDIVAEGVETPEQLLFVHERRCTRAQGYHIAMPMPIGAVDAWLSGALPDRTFVG
ncbi:MAG: EAL domain-containing protein [Acidimicrobiales bacterium]